ncbi:MAG TPA: fructosamine kinase family protein, partial [Longimicrobiaceae bacterium]|nr:fructosamine kinase family protein [Longimicrobiaceae bacterium]
MTLPPELRREAEARLGEVRAPRPVGGGCINECFRVDLPAGPAFLKYNLRAPAGFFAAEAEGLDALRAAAGDGLRVPAVLALGEATPWIALEWLEPA